MPVGAPDGIYGYDYDRVEKKRVVNEKECEVVKRIFSLFVDGWSMYRISKLLNEEGIPSKTGKRWQGGTIRDTLANRSYIGFDYFGKTKEVVGPDGGEKANCCSS